MIRVGNAASERVARRLGMRYVREMEFRGRRMGSGSFPGKICPAEVVFRGKPYYNGRDSIQERKRRDMYSFKNDYSEGAHPRIMQALLDTNLDQTDGYGTDPHCERARALIREKIACPEADVHFLVGGTQANLTVVAAALRPYQAVVAAHTGHVCVHETGAIEATGHKVVSMPSPDGRLTPAMVEEACGLHTDEHMVQPKMVYISDSTEVGTLYRKAELEALHDTCRALGLYLFLDGGAAFGGAHRRDERPLPARPRAAVRRLLPRRDQVRGALRRGGRHRERRAEARFPLPHQAAGRHARQGAAARHPV